MDGSEYGKERGSRRAMERPSRLFGGEGGKAREGALGFSLSA
jgi:hypothetical protein